MTELLTESEQPDDEELPYEDLDTEQFFDSLLESAAENLGVTVDELADKSFSEIEEKLEIEVKDPYHPRGSREGYRSHDRLNTVGREEHKRRRRIVNEWLNLS